MSKYKMIVSDLDGTLLRDITNVSEENYEAIKKLDEMGITFVFATGRSCKEVPQRLREFKSVKYQINSNGASVRNSEGEVIDSALISPEKYRQALEILREYKCHRAVHIDGRACVDSAQIGDEIVDEFHVPPLYLDIFRRLTDKIENLEEYALDNREVEFICCFFASDEELFECKDRLMELGGLSVTSSAKFNLEVVAEGALKGDAVTRLANKLGIKKEEIIAVGDSRNDISLLEVAGMPLAVENANDALKKCAKKVICNHKDHIAKYILENIV